jgi:hypothetical protein
MEGEGDRMGGRRRGRRSKGCRWARRGRRAVAGRCCCCWVSSAVPGGMGVSPTGAAAYPGGHGRPGHDMVAMIWWSRSGGRAAGRAMPASWRQAHAPCGTARCPLPVDLPARAGGEVRRRMGRRPGKGGWRSWERGGERPGRPELAEILSVQPTLKVDLNGRFPRRPNAATH